MINILSSNNNLLKESVLFMNIIKKHIKITVAGMIAATSFAYSGFANNTLAVKIISVPTKKSDTKTTPDATSSFIVTDKIMDKMKEETDKKIRDIISELKLRTKRLNIKSRCDILQMYIMQNNKFDKKLQNISPITRQQSESIKMTYGLYNATVKEQSTDMFNALMFKTILNKVGVEVDLLKIQLPHTIRPYYFNAVYTRRCAKSPDKVIPYNHSFFISANSRLISREIIFDIWQKSNEHIFELAKRYPGLHMQYWDSTQKIWKNSSITLGQLFSNVVYKM